MARHMHSFAHIKCMLGNLVTKIFILIWMHLNYLSQIGRLNDLPNEQRFGIPVSGSENQTHKSALAGISLFVVLSSRIFLAILLTISSSARNNYRPSVPGVSDQPGPRPPVHLVIGCAGHIQLPRLHYQVETSDEITTLSLFPPDWTR